MRYLEPGGHVYEIRRPPRIPKNADTPLSMRLTPKACLAYSLCCENTDQAIPAVFMAIHVPMNDAAPPTFPAISVVKWVKNHTGLGAFYRSRHELVLVFKHGRAPHRNNIQLGRYGRDRTNVWAYPGPRTPSEEGNLLLRRNRARSRQRSRKSVFPVNCTRSRRCLMLS